MKNDLINRYVEFKVYGFYTEVAKELNCTSDQVSTVYDWILNKTLTEFKQKEDSIQIEIKGLGKLHFDPKKGYIYLKKLVLYKMGRSIKYFHSIVFDEEGNLNEVDVNNLGRHFIFTRAILRRHKRLDEYIRLYQIKLDRFYLEGNLVENQYQYFKKNLITLINQQQSNYESIQRILEANPERFEELRQNF